MYNVLSPEGICRTSFPSIHPLSIERHAFPRQPSPYRVQQQPTALSFSTTMYMIHAAYHQKWCVYATHKYYTSTTSLLHVLLCMLHLGTSRACAALGRSYLDERLQQQLTSRRDRQPPMMTVRCRLRHVWRPGLASITACSILQLSITKLVPKICASRWTGGLIGKAGAQGAGTCTAAGLMDRQPLMLRLLRWRSFSAHAAMDASVSFRQQCRPRAISLLQFSATATTPMSRTCTHTCRLM